MTKIFSSWIEHFVFFAFYHLQVLHMTFVAFCTLDASYSDMILHLFASLSSAIHLGSTYVNKLFDSTRQHVLHRTLQGNIYFGSSGSLELERGYISFC